MAQQQYYRPQRRGSNDVYDDPGFSAPTAPSAQSASVSSGAGKTLSNIDEALAANATQGAKPGGGGLSPGSLDQQEKGIGHGALGKAGHDLEGHFVKAALGPEAGAALTGIEKLKHALGGNKENRRRTALIGGGTTGTVGIVALLFMALLPYKLDLMIQHIEDRFSATSQEALSNVEENMFDAYLRKHVFPSLGANCPSTRRTKSCVDPASFKGKNPVVQVYKRWAQGNAEGLLADKGVEFRRTGFGKTATIEIKIQGRAPQVLDLKRDVFTQIDSGEARQAFKDIFAGETRYKQLWYRWKLRDIKHKYGALECVIACSLQRKWNDTVTDKKKAFTAYFAQRVLEPHSAALSLALQCLIDTSCDPNKVSSDPNDPEHGAPESDYERNLQQTMQQYAAKFGDDSLKDILKSVNDLLEKGLTRFMVEQIAGAAAGKLVGKEAAKETVGEIAGKAVPVIGWINLAAEIVGGAASLGSKIHKLSYVTKIPAYIGMYTMFRTVVDEQRSGFTDPTELGSFNNALAPSANGPGAETSPEYQSVFENTTNGATALLRTFLPSKAYAATNALQAQSYLNYCDGSNADSTTPGADTKKPIAGGGKVCPEENLGTGSALADSISASIPSVVVEAAHIWNTFIGTPLHFIGNVIGSLISHIPGLSQLSNWAVGLILPILETLLKTLIPNPIHVLMSGARIIDIVIGGADALFNESAHYLLGGQKLTNQQAAAILNQHYSEEKIAFENQSLWARMFDKNSEYSLVGQVALALPTNTQTAVQSSFADLLANPFSQLLHGFSTMFTTDRAFAATQAEPDPYSIDQYGYPAGTVPSDPEQYWSQHCQNNNQTAAWQSQGAGNLNPLTQVPTNNTTDPCLLIDSGTDPNVGGQVF
jgi:hypothetical protein